MSEALFTVVEGDGPIIATAVHAGHALRSECATLTGLDEATRLREEDPYTDRVARAAPTHIIALRSRFEVDLNRPRDKAVYATPEDAWGLNVWRSPLGGDAMARSLAEYDAFYAELERVIRTRIERHGRVAVLDIHSYNHRRGDDRAPADPKANPEINVGTGSVDRARWGGLVEHFVADLLALDFDARENVKFQGGEMSKWVHRTFPSNAVCLAIELKKTFMDEWTGVAEDAQLAHIGRAIAATMPGLIEELGR